MNKRLCLFSSSIVWAALLCPYQAVSQEMISSALPDAPSAALMSSSVAPDAAPGEPAPQTVAHDRVAPKYVVVVEPDYRSVHLNAKDKVFFGAHEIVSWPNLASVFIAAGISQGADSDPLYGRDGTAFAQRVGAAAVRNTSQYVFSDMVLHPLLHTDPRYYVMGPGHNVIKRFFYAGTRTVIGRTDSGRTVPNLAMIGGYGATAAMTQLYYPPRSNNAETVLSSWGLSLGGKAFGYELAEFCRFLGRHQPR